MPTYVFECSACKKVFETLCRSEEIRLVSCDICGAKKPKQLMTAPRAVIFKQPKGTSFEDKFDYVAQWNMDNAKDIRRHAEQNSHMGMAPYNNLDDISGGDFFGEVK